MKKRPIQAYACVVLGMILALMLGFVWGRGSLIISREAMDALKNTAYYGISAQDLDRAAVKGMIDVLSDPMATYLTPETMDSFAQQLQGNQVIGLGLETIRVAEGYYVCAVKENSPAQIGGIAKGDIITSIDGKRVDKGAIWAAMTDKQKVELEIKRNGNLRTQSLFAASIDQFSDVEMSFLNGTTGYVRIRSFSQTGMEEKAIEAIKACLKKGNAILDLRHNPGGRLDAALAIAGAFVKKGQLLLTLHEANGADELYRSHDGSLSDKRLIVLVDSQSASASEVLAGILHDHGAALIIGEKTYGKGTVQRVVKLKDGGGIRFTIAEYELPSGFRLNGQGIMPDIQTAGGELPGWAQTPSQDELLQIALQNIAK